MDEDEIPLKPKVAEELTTASSGWTLKRDEPEPTPPKPAADGKASRTEPDDEEDEDDPDAGLMDEAGSLLDELKTVLGDRRCKISLAPRILRFLYPIMMLGVSPFVCLLFEMAVYKGSGLISAMFALPFALLLLFVQIFVYRVCFELAYAMLADRK
jgi:hypothetical protein